MIETTEPTLRELPTEINIEGSIAGWVWQNQQAFVTGDVEKETRFNTTKGLRDYPVKSICVLPLSTAQSRLGVLSIVSSKRTAYEHIDLEFAQLVASQIAVLMESQCYQQQLERARDRSQLLLEINNMLVSNLNLRELLTAISACLRRAIPHDVASLALYDAGTNSLRATALEFPDNEDLFIEDEALPIETTPAGQAFTTRKPIISNAQAWKEYPHARRFIDAGIQSGCTVPLISHDRPVGVLTVASLRENAFTEEHTDLLVQVANKWLLRSRTRWRFARSII